MSVEKVLRRKLEFLGYPNSRSFSVQEDRVIRCLPIGERFRDTDSGEWQTYVESYLKKVKCPYRLNEPQCMVDYLLNYGIEVRNENEGNIVNNLDSSTSSEDIFANIDTENSEFKEGVKKLSKLLSIPEHPDPKQSFRAICVLIEKMLSEATIKRAKEKANEKVELQKTEDIFLGFDVSDPQLRSAAVALRLLHVSELRSLQDLINHAIVQVQKLTADPKTDASQGRVGF
ncbi:hypothetical protein Aperf_G00000020854 [Anoplocephala perfoliata]